LTTLLAVVKGRALAGDTLPPLGKADKGVQNKEAQRHRQIYCKAQEVMYGKIA